MQSSYAASRAKMERTCSMRCEFKESIHAFAQRSACTSSIDGADLHPKRQQAQATAIHNLRARNTRNTSKPYSLTLPHRADNARATNVEFRTALATPKFFIVIGILGLIV